MSVLPSKQTAAARFLLITSTHTHTHRKVANIVVSDWKGSTLSSPLFDGWNWSWWSPKEEIHYPPLCSPSSAPPRLPQTASWCWPLTPRRTCWGSQGHWQSLAPGPWASCRSDVPSESCRSREVRTAGSPSRVCSLELGASWGGWGWRWGWGVLFQPSLWKRECFFTIKLIMKVFDLLMRAWKMYCYFFYSKFAFLVRNDIYAFILFNIFILLI